MTRPHPVPAALAAGLVVLACAGPARAQEVPEADPAPAEAPAERPKPKPRPRPKPPSKPTPPSKPKEPPATEEAPKPAEPAPKADIPPAPVTTGFAAPPVACEPGQAVHYDGPKGLDLWVTRSGTITVDNPLRPLTPDVTRVLQVVVGGRLATVYGPDLMALRRGGTPAVLEGTIGAKARWDANLAVLPDPLSLVTETGAALAELRFQACGEAPAAKQAAAPTARRTKPPAEARPARRAAPAPGTTQAPVQGAAPASRGLPQGAIP